jgi:hypothetical protein
MKTAADAKFFSSMGSDNYITKAGKGEKTALD